MPNRSAVLSAPGSIVLETRDSLSPTPDQAIVEILAVGVCGSDIHYFQDGRIGEFVVDSPLVLGHEASGRVVEVGSAVTSVVVGDRVAIEPGVPCGRCTQCRGGRYNLCPDVRFLATPPIDGAFTERLAVRADFLHKVPDSLSDAAAALVEPLAVAIWANMKATSSPHTRVLVTGAGPVGLLVASVARVRGAESVIITDVSQERLTVAASMGFDARMAGETTDLGQVDVLIECSGSQQAVSAGIRSLSPGGIAVLVGMATNTDLLLPVGVIQNRELVITGTFRYANVYPTAIALAASGRIDLDTFVSRTYALADVELALRAPGSDPSIIKVIVTPQAATA